MGSNTFGTLFQVTTWGESHGKGIGVVIDGCPPGIPLSSKEIDAELKRRRPGNSPFTSPRKEEDLVEIYSGLFEGKTTGAPLSLIIHNKDVDSSHYEPLKNLLKPGHANFTYLAKYGIFDYRGGGRASARETAARVAAGAVAKKLLKEFNIIIIATIKQIGKIAAQNIDPNALPTLKEEMSKSALFCPDPIAEKKMQEAIFLAQKEKDSLGGIVECFSLNLPAGLGDPIFDKLEATLAKGMMSLPASKGFEIGAGFNSVCMKGSEHNDVFIKDIDGNIVTKTNHSGGTLGGISTGMPLIFRVAFKPTSSIARLQNTLSKQGEEKSFKLVKGSRHDPCVAIRAVPVVEAMAAITIADHLLLQRKNRSYGTASSLNEAESWAKL